MFSVTAKTQYGIRALVHLAERKGEASTAAEIAESQSISPKYLEGILSRLAASGLLISERGKHGGYHLSRNPEDIAMLEVVNALEGEIKPVGCVNDMAQCGLGVGCLPRKFWIELKESIDGYLESRTLKDITGL